MADKRQITLQILGDSSGAIKALQSIDKQTGGLGNTLKRVGAIATGFIAANVIQGGVQRLTGYVGNAVSQAAALEQSIGGVESVFGDNAKQILEWGKTAATQAGLSRNAFNELAVPLGAMLKNSGMADFSDQTLVLTQRAADMAATFGGPVDQALSAITAGLRGEVDPLERYGVKLSAAAVEARALADSGKTSAAALTEQEKAAARVSLVLEQTAVAQGKFAAEAETSSGKQAIQAAAAENLAARLGEKLLPIQIAVTEAKMRLVEAITVHVLPAVERLSDWMGERLPGQMDRVRAWIDENRPQIEAFFRQVRAVGEELWRSFVSGLEVVMPKLAQLAEFLATNRPAMVAAITAIGVAIFLAMGPVSQAALAIAGLITAIGWLRDNWTEVLDWIKSKAVAVLDWLGSPAGLLALTVLLGPAGAVLGAVFMFRDEFGGAFEKIWDVVERVAGWIIDRINDVKSALATMPSPSDIPGAGLVGQGISAVGGFLGGFRAEGGPVTAGKAYVVGERGPEVFVPRQSGHIVPNGGGAPGSVAVTAASAAPVININIRGGTIVGSSREFQETVRKAIDGLRERGVGY